MNEEQQENLQNISQNRDNPAGDQELLETRISEQLVLEHPSYKKLLEQLSQEEQKSQELRNNWLLSQADLENLKRRTEKEVANAHKYALEKFAYEILAVVDNLERSLTVKTSDNDVLKDFYIGIELTLKSLLEILQKFGVTPIFPVIGEEFNHEKHTAVTTRLDQNAKANAVLEIIQKGYWFKDRLLRPALVVVAKHA